MKTQTAQTEPKLTKKQQRILALETHYLRCANLAKLCGHPNPDGKKISVALWKLEKEAHNAATAQCNGEEYQGQPYRSSVKASHQAPALSEWEYFEDSIKGRLSAILGSVPAGYYLNQDARGYALKISPDYPQGAVLIRDAGMHTDWGGNGILSPDL